MYYFFIRFSGSFTYHFAYPQSSHTYGLTLVFRLLLNNLSPSGIFTTLQILPLITSTIAPVRFKVKVYQYGSCSLDNFKTNGYKPNIKRIWIKITISTVIHVNSIQILIGKINNGISINIPPLLTLDDADSYCFLSQ